MEPETTAALLEYPYSWHPTSTRSLDDFLIQHKPSTVRNDGRTPWIWIHSGREPAYVPPGKREEAIARASNALREATEWLKSIDNEDPISVHATASVAIKKKFVKEARDITTEHLKRISVETGHVNGKWMVFPYHNEVDDVWKRLAKSIHSGPLSSTAIYCAKVSTTPAVLPRGWQHVICLYMSDVYDMVAAREARFTSSFGSTDLTYDLSL
ncbi:hypothetical protein SISNIDRAFT_490274 [Sistotremastrum niveocremeum HHB9708]|uniref:Uncharacterized protein n=1 Tax=Sistotremastrum niveocremeum HHB9708 TaxID=1314777 RepID=A0A164P1G2_9AGAM|nr:hypothetical protein SISNIDRAFT_490274 [Sistotremastrum niveocremeum HHB9708]